MENQKTTWELSDQFFNLYFYIDKLVFNWLRYLKMDYKDFWWVNKKRMFVKCCLRMDLPNWEKILLVGLALNSLWSLNLLLKMLYMRDLDFGKNKKSLKVRLQIVNHSWQQSHKFIQEIVSQFSIQKRMNSLDCIYQTLEPPQPNSHSHTNLKKDWEEKLLDLELEFNLNFQKKLMLKNSKEMLEN